MLTKFTHGKGYIGSSKSKNKPRITGVTHCFWATRDWWNFIISSGHLVRIPQDVCELIYLDYLKYSILYFLRNIVIAHCPMVHFPLKVAITRTRSPSLMRHPDAIKTLLSHSQIRF